MPWLFPGGRPGHPLDAGRISDRLKAIGLHPRADRAAALFTLAAELPAAILARTLGISIRTAVQLAENRLRRLDDLRRRPQPPPSGEPDQNPAMTVTMTQRLSRLVRLRQPPI